MISSLAATFFDEWIAERFKANLEVRRYLATHERRQLCLDKICEQIRMAELSNIGARLNLRRVRMLAEAGAEIFCRVALEHVEQRLLSQAERQRMIDEANRIDSLKETLIDMDVIKDDKPEKIRCE